MKTHRYAWARPKSAPFNRVAHHIRIVGAGATTLCGIETTAKTEFGDVGPLRECCRACAREYHAHVERERYQAAMAAGGES